jgi:hypothetical protein
LCNHIVLNIPVVALIHTNRYESILEVNNRTITIFCLTPSVKLAVSLEIHCSG